MSQAVPRALFSAVLRPQRGTSLRAIHVVMAWVAGLWLATGVGFYLAGAWPVIGFLSLEVVLLYAALRLCRGRGRAVETIELTATALTVCHIDHRGARRSASFQPHWLQVVMEGAPGHRLVLRSHGRSVAVGGFLTAEERHALAERLGHALANLTRPCAPARV